MLASSGCFDTNVLIKSRTLYFSLQVRGLSQSESEKRVVKHLENSIKQKIAKSGLEFGGRTIEVKVITAGGGGLPGTGGGSNSIGGPDDDLLLGNVKSEEEKQLQGMVYNLMVSGFSSLLILFGGGFVRKIHF